MTGAACRESGAATPRIPHPIPYQGSKRSLAPLIDRSLPDNIGVWFEPFAGSAAMSLWVAARRRVRHIVLGDSLTPIIRLWAEIIERPRQTADRYTELWLGQKPRDSTYFNRVRERFNANQDPVDLLYLLCRCVKNAVRFNAAGRFTQSVDRRRLGMHPDRMRAAITGASLLLRGKTELRAGDWLTTLADAGRDDFAYLDPPYHGTSTGRDRRYAEWMTRDRLIAGLSQLNDRSVRFVLSYDGTTGARAYGPPLPDTLGLTRLHLHAGRSSQATLNGVAAETIESLYLSPGVASLAGSSPRSRRGEAVQTAFAYG
ncbi:MAG: DNA adenine methylase [Acetobacteraceae bacterium]